VSTTSCLAQSRPRRRRCRPPLSNPILRETHWRLTRSAKRRVTCNFRVLVREPLSSARCFVDAAGSDLSTIATRRADAVKHLNPVDTIARFKEGKIKGLIRRRRISAQRKGKGRYRPGGVDITRRLSGLCSVGFHVAVNGCRLPGRLEHRRRSSLSSISNASCHRSPTNRYPAWAPSSCHRPALSPRADLSE
jgi:hypothetical protein